MHATRRRPEVKPTRKAPRPAGRFGAGILASRPTFKAPFTLGDESWYLMSREDGPDYDAMARESAAMDSYEAGRLAI